MQEQKPPLPQRPQRPDGREEAGQLLGASTVADPRQVRADAAASAQKLEKQAVRGPCTATPGKSKAVALRTAPNVDYSKFDRIVKAADWEGRGEVVMISGREGWNSCINGIYLQDGWLNERPRLRKRGEHRWLKFNDANQWMISKHQDGRPLGEALVPDTTSTPSSIRGTWYVCSEKLGWEPDSRVAACSGQCGHCRAVLERPLRCGVCRAVGYCSSGCQRADWRFHKRTCKKAAAPADAAEGVGEPEALPNVAEGAPAVREREDGQEDSGSDGEAAVLGDHAALVLQRRRRHAAQEPTPEPQRIDALQGGEARRHAEPLSPWNGAGTWEERNLLAWSRERLTSLLVEPPELSVPCGIGNIRVIGVEHIDGFASIGLNRGERRHLFDLSFDIKFEATMINDFKISREGEVSITDFTSSLETTDIEDTFYGMDVKFVDIAEAPLEKPRKVVEAAVSQQQRMDVIAAVGASRDRVQRGEGLMHLVHRRLQAFAEEFARQ